MNRLTNWLAVLAIAALGGSAYFRYAQQEAHTHLVAQVQLLNQVLAAENDRANAAAAHFIQAIQAKVDKNQSKSAEVAILHICQDLRVRTATLLDTLHAHRARLLHLTGNRFSASQLLPPAAIDLLTKDCGLAPMAQQSLAAQFARYTAALPDIMVDSQKVAPLTSQPVVSVLANLAQTETDLLTTERHLLRYFERRVGAPTLAKRIIAVATAESNIVRPNTTYQAEFYLVKQFVLPIGNLRMQCNNQPILVDSNGVGQVQFRAPNRLGPATWTGSIRYNFNGRDTTFQVRVPYRVARH